MSVHWLETDHEGLALDRFLCGVDRHTDDTAYATLNTGMVTCAMCREQLGLYAAKGVIKLNIGDTVEVLGYRFVVKELKVELHQPTTLSVVSPETMVSRFEPAAMPEGDDPRSGDLIDVAPNAGEVIRRMMNAMRGRDGNPE